MEVKSNVSFLKLRPQEVRHHHQVIAMAPNHRELRVQEPDFVNLVRYLHIELRVVLQIAIVKLRHVERVEEVVHARPHAAFVMLHVRLHFFYCQEHRVAVLLAQSLVRALFLSLRQLVLGDNDAHPHEVIGVTLDHVIEKSKQKGRVVAAFPSRELIGPFRVGDYFVGQVESAQDYWLSAVDWRLIRKTLWL